MTVAICVTMHRSEILNDNKVAGMNKYKRAKMIAALREKGRWAAVADRIALENVQLPCRVTVWYAFPDRKRRPRDANNLSATTKPLIDGITDSKHAWPNDDVRYVIGQDSRIDPEPTGDIRGIVRATIVIEDA